MKAFFLSRQTREKVLLVGLVLVAALWWLTAAIGRTTTFIRDFKSTSLTLKVQQMTLDARESIQARANAAIRQLDPSRTYDTVRLQAELDTIATAVGITNKTISDARTEKTAQFSVNSAQITVRNTDYATVVKFYEEIKKRTPYIGLDQLTIQPSNVANPTQLTLMLKVSSVEILR
ncbi:hypothetical protein [Ereboglobus luteus]|uniref:General secretion pathway protein GspM n=1 Tax=Ereboglobus luteus TaxID=1796921 RepID=A0A2U8E3E9_9BACT|nr:hypothetical protein [Ereboglobus luteus]AWI09234.1 hypothetical protein CKA38_08270 [Ereboglobus luteus]